MAAAWVFSLFAQSRQTQMFRGGERDRKRANNKSTFVGMVIK